MHATRMQVRARQRPRSDDSEAAPWGLEVPCSERVPVRQRRNLRKVGPFFSQCEIRSSFPLPRAARPARICAACSAMCSTGFRNIPPSVRVSPILVANDRSVSSSNDSSTATSFRAPSQTGSQANEFDFAGQQSDASTGLQYLRARYYDPATGAFISRDPSAARPSWLVSHYGYAGANPVNASDPTGLCSFTHPFCLAEAVQNNARRVAEVAVAATLPPILSVPVVAVIEYSDDIADAIDECASSTKCQTTVAFTTVTAGVLLSETPLGPPLILAGMGMFTALDAQSCFEGSGMGCAFLGMDVASAGAMGYGKGGAYVATQAVLEPWQAMLQESSVALFNATKPWLLTRLAAESVAGASAGVEWAGGLGDYNEGIPLPF